MAFMTIPNVPCYFSLNGEPSIVKFWIISSIYSSEGVPENLSVKKKNFDKIEYLKISL